jgi:hypothetical protein
MRVPLNALVVTLMIYAKKWKAYDVFGLTTVLLFTGAVSSLIFAYASTTVADTTTAVAAAKDSTTSSNNGTVTTATAATAVKDSKVVSGAQQEFNDKHAHAVALHDKAQSTAPPHDAADSSSGKTTTTATGTIDSAHEHNE